MVRKALSNQNWINVFFFVQLGHKKENFQTIILKYNKAKKFSAVLKHYTKAILKNYVRETDLIPSHYSTDPVFKCLLQPRKMFTANKFAYISKSTNISQVAHSH
jgi:hypothetical protein